MSYRGFNLKELRTKFEDLKLEKFEWNDIKRIPQSFKRKAKLGSFTFDEGFDELHRDFGVVEGQIKGLVQCCKTWSKELGNQIEISVLIGESYTNLFDPYNSLTRSDRDKLKAKSIHHISEKLFKSQTEVDDFVMEYELWQSAQEFTTKLNQMKFIGEDPRAVCGVIEVKCQQFLEFLENAKLRIKTRNNALDDYDHVFNQLDHLLLAAKTRTLTSKEAQAQFNLERKLDFCKHQYDTINQLFLKEFPVLLNLAHQFLVPILQLLYFTQLSTTYQLTCNLLSFQEAAGFDIDYLQDEAWIKEMIEFAQWNQSEAQECIDELEIAKFTKKPQELEREEFELPNLNTLQQVPQETVAADDTVEAIYPFEAQQPGDLSFQVGDTIRVLEQQGEWWRGENKGQIGLFPSNYTTHKKNC